MASEDAPTLEKLWLGGRTGTLAAWSEPELGLCVLSMRLDMKHVAGGPYALTPEHPSLPSPEQLGGVPEFMFLCCVVFLQRLLPFFRPCFLIPVSVTKNAIQQFRIQCASDPFPSKSKLTRAFGRRGACRHGTYFHSALAFENSTRQL